MALLPENANELVATWCLAPPAPVTQERTNAMTKLENELQATGRKTDTTGKAPTWLGMEVRPEDEYAPGYVEDWGANLHIAGLWSLPKKGQRK